MNKEYGNSISTQYTMKPLSRNAIIGYPAGIITGITYGLNPLFAVPLINQGVYIDSILFFRYGLSVVSSFISAVLASPLSMRVRR